MISAKAPKKNTFNLEGTGYISVKQNESNPRTQLKENDIIISTVGTIGNCAVVDKAILPANSDRHVGIIRVGKDSDYKPRFISTFLLSKYGRFQTKRHTTGNVQPNLFLYKIRDLKIPYISLNFQQRIEDIIVESTSLLQSSKEIYKEAEVLLEREFELDSYVEPKEICSVKSFSESFGESGRLDAQYYQEKFDVLFERLEKYNTEKLVDIVNISKSIEPGSEVYGDEGVPFLRVSDLSKYELTSPEIHIPKSIHPSIDNLYPKKDTILLSKDGSVGIAYKVSKDLECVTSSAILHLKIKDASLIQTDYLTLVLNSRVVQLQAERDAGGSIIQHWKPSEIKKVLIPILDINIQSAISCLVQQSFELREKANKKLEEAIQIVELAIEQGEEEALKSLS